MSNKTMILGKLVKYFFMDNNKNDYGLVLYRSLFPK